MSAIRTGALAALLLAAACAPAVPPPSPPDACALACEHARALECALGEPTPGGASCEDVCRSLAADGLDLGVDCIAAAPSCDALERCPTR